MGLPQVGHLASVRDTKGRETLNSYEWMMWHGVDTLVNRIGHLSRLQHTRISSRQALQLRGTILESRLTPILLMDLNLRGIQGEKGKHIGWKIPAQCGRWDLLAHLLLFCCEQQAWCFPFGKSVPLGNQLRRVFSVLQHVSRILNVLQCVDNKDAVCKTRILSPDSLSQQGRVSWIFSLTWCFVFTGAGMHKNPQEEQHCHTRSVPQCWNSWLWPLVHRH